MEDGVNGDTLDLATQMEKSKGLEPVQTEHQRIKENHVQNHTSMK